MPGKLKFYSRDPEGKRRGAGQYWHRGKGSYSKYTGNMDASVKAKKIPTKTAKQRRQVLLEQPHLGDVNRKIQTRRPSVIRGKRLVKTKKGWF